MAEEPIEAKGGRSTERAFALTLATLVLLTPPILGIFDIPVLIFGIPLLHIYSFGIWLAAIACGCWLSQRMDSGQARPMADNSAQRPVGRN